MLWFAKSLEEPRASNARADLLSRAELPAPLYLEWLGLPAKP
jgi:hypothetical protein